MIPRLMPIMAAWVRSLAPNLERMFFDSALDGFFGDGELIGNLFVGIPGGNQTQYAQFPRGSGRHRWHARQVGRRLPEKASFSRHARRGSSPAVPCAEYFSAGKPGRRLCRARRTCTSPA